MGAAGLGSTPHPFFWRKEALRIYRLLEALEELLPRSCRGLAGIAPSMQLMGANAAAQGHDLRIERRTFLGHAGLRTQHAGTWGVTRRASLDRMSEEIRRLRGRCSRVRRPDSASRIV